MKRIIILLVILIMCFFMVSCKSDVIDNKTETNDSLGVNIENTTDVPILTDNKTPQNTEQLIGIEVVDYPDPHNISEYEKLTDDQKLAFDSLSEVIVDFINNGPVVGKEYQLERKVSWFDYKLAFNILSVNFNSLEFLAYISSNEKIGENQYVDVLTLRNQLELEECYQKYLEMNAEAEKILSSLEHDGTEYGKAFAIAKWMVDNIIYPSDYKSRYFDHLRKAYNVIMTKEAVCSGYARAYDFLCKKAGLETIYVYNESINHAWNMICIDEKWYHIDVTWMDSGDNIYDNFMMPDSVSYATGHDKAKYYWNQVENETIILVADSYDLYKHYYGSSEDTIMYIQNLDLSNINVISVAFDNEEDSNIFSSLNKSVITDSEGSKYLMNIVCLSDLFYKVTFANIDTLT